MTMTMTTTTTTQKAAASGASQDPKNDSLGGAMSTKTLKIFEDWAGQLGYDLRKSPAMATENPFDDSGTWKAYEAFCFALSLS